MTVVKPYGLADARATAVRRPVQEPLLKASAHTVTPSAGLFWRRGQRSLSLVVEDNGARVAQRGEHGRHVSAECGGPAHHRQHIVRRRRVEVLEHLRIIFPQGYK